MRTWWYRIRVCRSFRGGGLLERRSDGRVVEGVYRQEREIQLPIHRPYYDLTQKEKDLLWHGARGLHGIDDFSSLWKRIFIKYNTVSCRLVIGERRPVLPVRLKPEALYVKVGGKNIAELVALPITEAKAF